MDRTILEGISENYREEASSHQFYLTLASLDRKAERRAVLTRLAGFEERHAQLWEGLLRQHDAPVPSFRMMVKHRVLVGLARLFGVATVLSAVHKDEVDGIRKYLDQMAAWKDADVRTVFALLLPDELSHEIDTLDEARSAVREGGSLRSAVLGANDGVVSVLALSAGVLGATVADAPVLIAGVAGLVAGAISMAASSYVSVKAEEEMYAGLRTLEKNAIQVDRETKARQLEEAYRAKGFTGEEARRIVARLAGNEREFTRALLAERHGIGEASFSNPLRLGAYTGFAFALSGTVPLLPFFWLPPLPAMVTSVAASGVVLFATGVFRSLSTLASLTRSGLEMVFIGLGSAGMTFGIGLLVGGLIH